MVETKSTTREAISKPHIQSDLGIVGVGVKARPQLAFPAAHGGRGGGGGGRGRHCVRCLGDVAGNIAVAEVERVLPLLT